MESSQIPPLENKITVLIVDDVDLNREMLSDFLELLGYDAISASNGQEALEQLKVDDPDLLLLDIDMPVLDGFGVLKAMRADDVYRHIPVIMISGSDETKNIARCIELGATDFLSKPFNATILEARLSSSLEKKLLRDRERELLGDLEKSYRSLLEAEQSRDAFVHMIVHDLSSPLSVVKLNTEMLAMADSGNDLTARALENISHAAVNMNQLIQEILDVSKLESGTMSVESTSIDPAGIMSRLAKDFELAAEERGLEITLETESGLSVQGDAMLVTRIIQNLIMNALRYASSATTIRLEAHSAGDGLVLLGVKDDGMGIEPEDRHRIFEKYFQSESFESGSRAGVGLGLSFCKLAVEALGGRIWAESPDEGGATFCIELPAA